MSGAIFACPGCARVVARFDRRRKEALVVVAPATMQSSAEAKEAPRVRCACGKSIVVIRGNAG
jgi:hypothetical protein